MSQVVVSRDCVYYEEFVQSPAPGHSVYEGSPLIGGADTAVNSDSDLDEDDALQVSPPLVVVGRPGSKHGPQDQTWCYRAYRSEVEELGIV